MTVYVDDMQMPAIFEGYIGRRPPNGAKPKWSHLMADTTEELVEFARKLGLKPEWIQYEGTVREHFDVVESKRKKAIALGAVSMEYGSDGTALLMEIKMAERDGEPAKAAELRERLQAIAGDAQGTLL